MYDAALTKVKDERIVVASDAHYWPAKKATTAHRALVDFLQRWPTDILIVNGDAFDGAGISTHPAKGWEEIPTVEAQLKVTKQRMSELRGASGAVPLYVAGNHELRFDKYLAKGVGPYKGISGMSLAEHFPEWTYAEKVELQGKEKCIVKHELSGGSNPLKQNLQKAGCHIVTGHHHAQNVFAFTDYAGTRYAVDAGMLGRPGAAAFSYGGGDPTNWRSGFVCLQWWGGRLLPPQLVTVLDEKKGEYWYNGFTYKV